MDRQEPFSDNPKKLRRRRTYIAGNRRNEHFVALRVRTSRLGLSLRFASHDGAVCREMSLHADIGVFSWRNGYDIVTQRTYYCFAEAQYQRKDVGKSCTHKMVQYGCTLSHRTSHSCGHLADSVPHRMEESSVGT